MDIKQVAGQASSQLQSDKTRDAKSSPGVESKPVDTEQAPLSNSDTLSLSSQSNQIQNAIASLENVPEIREGRVEEIRNSIAAGNFEINAEQTANKFAQFELDLFQTS